MAYEQKDMTGSAFLNQRKDRPTSADLTGTIKIEGKEYWLNVWNKSDKNGNGFISLSVRPRQPRAEPDTGSRAGEKPRRTTAQELLDDDIPF